MTTPESLPPRGVYLCTAWGFHLLFFLALVLATVTGVAPSRAAIYPLPPADVDLIGDTEMATARAEDTLLDIARRYSIGQDEIVLANPAVDRWLPGEGTAVLVPGFFILPPAERQGIVINLPEMRLYYYYHDIKEKRRMVASYPVSVGRANWPTPLGEATVESKERNPAWRPPESIREEARGYGKPLPDIVPPGPDNPLGRYALRLSLPGYLIHGTNKPYGVGMRVTHGCVRMYPEDIEELFAMVPPQTPVNIINQPVKVGWKNDILYLEAHPFVDEEGGRQDVRRLAYKMIFAEIEAKDGTLDLENMHSALRKKNGLPVPIAFSRAAGSLE